MLGVVMHLVYHGGNGVLDDCLDNNSLSILVKQIRNERDDETFHFANCQFLRDIRHQHYHEPRQLISYT